MSEQSTISKAAKVPKQPASRPARHCAQRHWPFGLWLIVICGFFIFQFCFAYVVSDRPLSATKKVTPFVARTVPGTLTEERLSQTFFTSDPLLFPLASQHGYSGEGWMTVNRFTYEFPEEIEPPHWLALRSENLGRVAPAVPKAELPFQLGQETTPQIEALPVFVTSVVPHTNSVVRVDANLRDRAIGLPMKLPARPATDVLSNSVVEIAVNGAGEVVARRLAVGSTSKDADRDALEKAKLLRFRPLNAVGTIWGQAIFEWQTTELPEGKK